MQVYKFPSNHFHHTLMYVQYSGHNLICLHIKTICINDVWLWVPWNDKIFIQKFKENIVCPPRTTLTQCSLQTLVEITKIQFRCKQFPNNKVFFPKTLDYSRNNQNINIFLIWEDDRRIWGSFTSCSRDWGQQHNQETAEKVGQSQCERCASNQCTCQGLWGYVGVMQWSLYSPPPPTLFSVLENGENVPWTKQWEFVIKIEF